MTPLVSGIQRRWNNGELQAWQPYGSVGFSEETAALTRDTGAERVVEIVWASDGRAHRAPFPCDVLPDRTGVVFRVYRRSFAQPTGASEPRPTHLRVINADGSLRFLFHAPVADGAEPLDTWVEPPKYFPQVPGIFAVHVFDGAQERLLEIDWDTGRIVRDLPTGNWLWM